MSDSSDLLKFNNTTQTIPSWLWDTPDDWFESYLDLVETCAVSARWGKA